MRRFNHPHIIKLLGVVMEEPSICIIMELAPLGEVSSCVHPTMAEHAKRSHHPNVVKALMLMGKYTLLCWLLSELLCHVLTAAELLDIVGATDQP